MTPNHEPVCLQFQITPAIVSALSDQQLSELGVTTIGDRAALRTACQRCGVRGGTFDEAIQYPSKAYDYPSFYLGQLAAGGVSMSAVVREARNIMGRKRSPNLQ